MRLTLALLTLVAGVSAQSLDTVKHVAQAQVRMVQSAKVNRNVLLWTAGSALLMTTTDHPTARFFQHNAIGGGEYTKLGMMLAPVALYGTGLIKHDSGLRDTAMYAAFAGLEAQGLALAGKHALSRTSPSGAPGRGVFVSSHTSVAFAVASVVAHRSHNRWVKVGAYTAAGLVGLSTIAQNGHYPSDVAIGAGLGFAAGTGYEPNK